MLSRIGCMSLWIKASSKSQYNLIFVTVSPGAVEELVSSHNLVLQEQKDRAQHVEELGVASAERERQLQQQARLRLASPRSGLLPPDKSPCPFAASFSTYAAHIRFLIVCPLRSAFVYVSACVCQLEELRAEHAAVKQSSEHLWTQLECMRASRQELGGKRPARFRQRRLP